MSRYQHPTVKIFKKLSVFRGGFRRPAAQVVAGASLRNLVSLANKSLLRRDPATARYEMHELLRQYAGQHLEVVLKSISTYRTLAMAIIISPAAAIVLAAHKGRRVRAVEWLALAFHHPASPAGLKKWPLLARLRANLEAELGSEIYTSAWQRGQELDLWAVLAALPGQLGGETPG